MMPVIGRFLANRRATRPLGSALEQEEDVGLILPLVLVLTVVLGGVVVGIASYTTTSLRYGRAVQDRADRLAASDGAMRVALEMMRTGKGPVCGTAPSTFYATTVNRKSVTVSCQRTLLLPDEAAPFALVVTAEGVPKGGSWISDGTAIQPRAIGGNVYLTDPPAVLDKPVSVTDGDVWYWSDTCPSTDPNIANITIKPADERGYNCTTSTWSDMFKEAALPLPAVNPTPRRATGTPQTDGCILFKPGTYLNPPVIGSGTQNFFQPGTYYFNFSGSIDVKNALVIGGVAGLDTTTPKYIGSSPIARSPTTFSSSRCNKEMQDAAASPAPDNTGVTWVFGGGSRISIDGNGFLELFETSRPTDSQPLIPSIVALQYDDPVHGYLRNTLGANIATPLLDMKEGSNDGLVIHGGVWAPTAAVKIGNIAQNANGQFMGGLVVALLNMQSAANVGNFNMRVVTKPAQRKNVVTSVADGRTSTKVVALVRKSTFEVFINSWRVE